MLVIGTYVSILVTNRLLSKRGVEIMNERYSSILDLDDYLAKMLINIETLEQIHYKFTSLRQQVDHYSNHNCLIDKEHMVTVRILDDLLFYTLVDMNEHHRKMLTLIDRIVTNKKTAYTKESK